VADNLPPDANPPGHLTDQQIEFYRRGAAAPTELLDWDDHLTDCAKCRERLSDIAPARDLLRWAEGLPHTELEPETKVAAPSAAAPARTSSRWLRGSALWIPAAAAALVLAFFGWQAIRKKNEPVIVAENFRVVVRDAGASLALRDDGTLVAPAAVAQADRPLITAALETGTLPSAPADPELVSRPGVLRGVPGPSTFALLAPLGTAQLSDRPEFRWEALDGARSYKVQIFDIDFREVASSGTLSATTWKPERPLARNKLYQWQVTAQRGSETVRAPAPPAPEARFRVVDEATAARIEAARPSHLAVAILCAQAGLRDDARQELEAMRADNPDSDVVKKLLASLQ
jgi:hypothetical protein